MKRIAMIACGVALMGWNGEAEVPLPDENGCRAALGCEPFPSRLHQFIWRNWAVVPQDRLAQVLKTSPGNVARIAASLGLPQQMAILPEWQDRGYITVLRRNWHLLPYSQLTELLGFSRERLRYALLEDDFLFIKLGSVKPACEPLLYAPPAPAEDAAAARLAGWLREEGLEDPGDEEPASRSCASCRRPTRRFRPSRAAAPRLLNCVLSSLASRITATR